MGIGMADVDYIVDLGHLPAQGARILDIGSQNLFNVTPAAVTKLARRFGNEATDAELSTDAKRLSYFSTPRAGERTTYLSELFDLTPKIFYTSFDVCLGLKTEILDLNEEDLPEKYNNSFDVVLNCGTTEHVTNQFNSFKVIHEATKVGGIMLHTVPTMGWLEHGYFTYHATFFDDLAAANGYEIVDRWYTPERMMALDPEATDIRSAYSPQSPHSASLNGLQLTVQCFNQSVVLRKLEDLPFRVKLELATSHSGLSDTLQSKYTAN